MLGFLNLCSQVLTVASPVVSRADRGAEVASREMGSFLNGLKRSDESREMGSFLNGLKRSDEQESSHIAAPVGTPQEVATPKITPGAAFILAAPVIARSLTATTKRADQYASFAKRMEAPPVANSEMVIGFRAVPIHSQAAPMIADQVHHQVVVPVVAHQPVVDRRRYVHHAAPIRALPY